MQLKSTLQLLAIILFAGVLATLVLTQSAPPTLSGLVSLNRTTALRPTVRNSYGAMGLMQVVPRFHKEKIEQTETLFDPDVNVRVGAQILGEYRLRSNGNWEATLKKYSGNARNYSSVVMAETARSKVLGSVAVSYALGQWAVQTSLMAASNDFDYLE